MALEEIKRWEELVSVSSSLLSNGFLKKEEQIFSVPFWIFDCCNFDIYSSHYQSQNKMNWSDISEDNNRGKKNKMKWSDVSEDNNRGKKNKMKWSDVSEDNNGGKKNKIKRSDVRIITGEKNKMKWSDISEDNNRGKK